MFVDKTNPSGTVTQKTVQFFGGIIRGEYDEEGYNMGVRLLLIVRTPFEILAVLADTLLGLVLAVGTILTFGASKDLRMFAKRHLETLNYLVAQPVKNLLCIMNTGEEATGGDTYEGGGWEQEKGRGLCTQAAYDFQNRKARYFLKSRYCQVAARLIYLITIPLLIVARVVDLAIGVIALAVSLLTLAQFRLPNQLAYRGLKFSGVVDDVVQSLICFINPPPPQVQPSRGRRG